MGAERKQREENATISAYEVGTPIGKKGHMHAGKAVQGAAVLPLGAQAVVSGGRPPGGPTAHGGAERAGRAVVERAALTKKLPLTAAVEERLEALMATAPATASGHSKSHIVGGAAVSHHPRAHRSARCRMVLLHQCEMLRRMPSGMPSTGHLARRPSQLMATVARQQSVGG